jgi:hypothetical protein
MSVHCNRHGLQVRKLLVYQKAIDFADVVCCKTEEFSRGYGFLSEDRSRM